MTGTRAEASSLPRAHDLRGRPPAAAILATLAVFAACAVPFVLWGNPYPAAVVRYWLWGGALTLGIAAGMASAPIDQLRTMPERLASLILRASSRAFAVGIAAGMATLGVVVAVYSFSRSPSTPDEISLLWQAQLLLRGRLSLPVDPAREFFSLETIVDIGRWYAQFPIGGPIAMVPGALLHAPWVVNPLFAGVGAAAFYHFSRRTCGELQGRVMALSYVASPMILLMTGTWMNHVPVMCLACCSFAALVEWERASDWRRRLLFAAALGLLLGFIATIRPLDAIVIAVVVGAFQLIAVVRRDARRLGDLFVQAAFGALGVAPLLIANARTTGSAFTFGYDVLWGAGHRIGFHANPHGNVHTLQRGMELAATYVSELNMYLLAWPVPALLLLVGGLLAMREITRWDGLMLGFFGAQVAAYAAYWGEGEFLGPRFLFTALPAMIYLLVRGGASAAQRAGTFGRRVVTALAVVCIIAAWGAPALPFNARGLARQAREARRNLKLDVAGAVKYSNAHNALIFLREPLATRLARRMWGLGLSRSTAAQLLNERDACSLLAAVRAAEADDAISIEQAATRLAADVPSLQLRGGNLRIASMASIDAECRAELDGDTKIGNVPFGLTLPLQPIGADGRIGGDVIFAADLGPRNETLRARFGDRAWYRLVSVQEPSGKLRVGLAPY